MNFNLQRSCLSHFTACKRDGSFLSVGACWNSVLLKTRLAYTSSLSFSSIKSNSPASNCMFFESVSTIEGCCIRGDSKLARWPRCSSTLRMQLHILVPAEPLFLSEMLGARWSLRRSRQIVCSSCKTRGLIWRWPLLWFWPVYHCLHFPGVGRLPFRSMV